MIEVDRILPGGETVKISINPAQIQYIQGYPDGQTAVFVSCLVPQSIMTKQSRIEILALIAADRA